MNSELLDEIREFSVPELCDGMEVFRTMDYQIKPIVYTERIVGPALTVNVVPGEGGFIPEAILATKPGDVIVIAGGGNCKSSYWGDMRSYCAKMAGAAAVIIDGTCRDVEGCKEIGFPIFARGITPGTALKTNKGQLNVPISCGGINVFPEDIIVADLNGVCVIRPDELPDVLQRTRRKIEAQRYTIEQMKETGKILPRVIFPQ